MTPKKEMTLPSRSKYAPYMYIDHGEHRYKRQTAIKAHTCDVCNCGISVGEQYFAFNPRGENEWERLSLEGELPDVRKMCSLCEWRWGIKEIAESAPTDGGEENE